MDTNFLNSDSQGNSNISLQTKAEHFLKEAAKWGKFLAIIGFIGIGLMVLAAIFMFFTGASSVPTGMRNNPMGAFAGVMGASMGIVYLILAILYFFPTNYLYVFSNKIAAALKNKDSHLLTQGFGNLKSCFKFLGIMTIVIISLYVLMIVIFVIGLAMR